MSMPDVPGDCPIIATPFAPDGSIDYDSLAAELRAIADAGCEAATLFGIASEFFKLSDDERDRLAEFVTDAARDVGVSPVLSVTHESTRVAVERARTYEAAGADCIMVFPPRFLEPPTEAILRHLRRIGEAVSVPVMVQHTDQNVAVSPEQFADLHAEVPNVEYFKIERTPTGPFISALLDATDGGVTALVGNWGYEMIEAYDRGAAGVMPIAMYDELYVEIHDRHRAGDREGAVALHDALLAGLNDVDTIPAAKRLLVERGVFETARCREPVANRPDEVSEALLLEAHEKLMDVIDSL